MYKSFLAGNWVMETEIEKSEPKFTSTQVKEVQNVPQQAKKSDPAKIIEAEIKYLLESEEKYTNALLSLVEDRNHLTDTAPPFLKKWLSMVFRQVKPLATMHEDILSEMKSADMNIETICNIFLERKKSLHTYVYYIENIPTVDRVISENICYIKEHIPALVEKLRQPRMRLNHYVLIFESLQKRVDDDKKAKLQEIIEFCKTYLSQADRALLLGNIKGCPFRISDSGKVIHRSDIKLTKSPNIPSGLVHLVLMEQKILFLRVNDFDFIHSISTDDIDVKEHPRGLFFSILINKNDMLNQSIYYFKTRSIKAQQLWLTKLKVTIDAIQLTLVRNLGRASFGKSGRRSRIFIKKNSDQHVTRSRSTVSDHAESASDDEAATNTWRMKRLARRRKPSNAKDNEKYRGNMILTSKDELIASDSVSSMASLTIWNCFPRIEPIYKALTDANLNDTKLMDTIDAWSTTSSFMDLELQYIATINKQLGKFLDEEVVKPPKVIKQALRRLYAFHNNEFYPKLLDYDNNSPFDEHFLKTLVELGENFAVIYSEYMIDRCTYNEEMKELNLCDNYLSPVSHFIQISRFVVQLKKKSTSPPKVIETAVEVLRDTITNTNNFLLAESINNVPFALSQCEPILQSDSLKIKYENKGKKEYHVLLLKDQVIVLERMAHLYNYHSCLRLDSISVGPSSDRCHFQLEYWASPSVKKIVSFWALRTGIRDKWVVEIRRLLDQQRQKLRESLMKRMESPPSVPVQNSEGLTVPLHTISLSKSPGAHKKLSRLTLQLETDL